MGKRKLEVVERQTIDDILMDAIPGISHDSDMGQDYRISPSLLPAGETGINVNLFSSCDIHISMDQFASSGTQVVLAHAGPYRFSI